MNIERINKFNSIGFKSNFNNKCRNCGSSETRIKEQFNDAVCIDCFDLPREKKLYEELIKIKHKYNHNIIL